MNNILQRWNSVSRLPAGRWLFSQILGHVAPYSGSIRCRVLKMDKGFAQVELKDRKRVRNHLNSIHAIALINLGEIATCLAALSTINHDMRGIVTSINAEYLKKARGNLVATAEFKLPEPLENNTNCQVVANLVDETGDIVCVVTATWLLGYKQ